MIDLMSEVLLSLPSLVNFSNVCNIVEKFRLGVR